MPSTRTPSSRATMTAGNSTALSDGADTILVPQVDIAQNPIGLFN